MRTRAIRAAMAATAVALFLVPTPPPAAARAGSGRRRRGSPRRSALALDRPCAGRPIHRGRRKQQPAERVLLRRDRRRPLEDGRRWRHLARGLRRLLQVVVGRRRRRGRVPARRRLRRHGRSPAARQRHPGRRRLQVVWTPEARGRTWGSRAPWSSAASACIRPTPTSSTWRRSAIPTVRTRSGASSSRSTAARRGNACSSRNDQTGAADLSMDPKNPDVLYAGFWEVFRTPHSLSSGGPGSGLFKTTDGGKTWTELTRNPGLPAPLWGKVGVSVSGADRNRVYAIIEAAEGGVFLSNDAGATWSRVNDDRRLRQRAFYYTRIYADPQARDTVYVLNTGLYRSTDAGKTLAAIRVPHGDNHDLWIAPSEPARMINANDGGGNVSTNGGESWTDQDYPTAQFYNVFTTAHVPYHVCGAQQDNSTACVPSSGGGELYAVGGGESGYIAPDPLDVDVFYAGSYGGLLTRINRRTGERRAINIWPDNPMGFSASDITERFQWTFPDRHRADRSQDALRDVAARLEIHQRRPELAADQPRPHAPRSGDARALRRSDHARSDRRRDLRDGLHPRALGRQRQRHLGRLRRWRRARDARRGQDLDERHAGRAAAVHAHQPDRRLAARRGHGLPRRQPVSARRSRALRLQDGGLRQELDEDRQRRARRRLPACRARRPEAQGLAVSRHRDRVLRLVRRRRMVAAAARPACR